MKSAPAHNLLTTFSKILDFYILKNHGSLTGDSSVNSDWWVVPPEHEILQINVRVKCPSGWCLNFHCQPSDHAEKTRYPLNSRVLKKSNYRLKSIATWFEFVGKINWITLVRNVTELSINLIDKVSVCFRNVRSRDLPFLDCPNFCNVSHKNYRKFAKRQ